MDSEYVGLGLNLSIQAIGQLVLRHPLLRVGLERLDHEPPTPGAVPNIARQLPAAFPELVITTVYEPIPPAWTTPIKRGPS